MVGLFGPSSSENTVGADKTAATRRLVLDFNLTSNQASFFRLEEDESFSTYLWLSDRTLVKRCVDV